MSRGQLDPRLALGNEHRAGLAALQQAGHEPDRAGLPDDDVDRAALAADLGPPVGQVQVLNVEREHLGRPWGGLVRHPPAIDIPGGTEQQYEQITATLFPDGKLPDGWLVHLAGPTADGWRVVNVAVQADHRADTPVGRDDLAGHLCLVEHRRA
jgi:hypothetical protein